jgi:branched-chain amino acid transport system substrate-binding protein
VTRSLSRMLIVALALALVVPGLFIRQVPAAEDVKIALVAPLSGRWARQGQLKKMGAEMAIEEINSQGGIKALGGAKIVLREADAGDSVEKAVSAAQRVLTREKISAGIGSWLSSFNLGVTEVAERLQVPWLSLSYADSITERGFKYTFQTSPVSSLQAEQALDLVTDLAKKNNRPIKKAGIVGDNTAASMFFYKPLREKLLAAKGSSSSWTTCGRRPSPTRPRSRRSYAPPSPTSCSTAPPTSPTRSRCSRRSRSSA